MPNSPTTPCLIVPHAGTPEGTFVLIARVAFVAHRQPGRPSPSVASIPHHAGQWVPIGGALAEDDRLPAAAFGIFAEATGIDLGDRQVRARFALDLPVIVRFVDADLNPVTALYVAADRSGLAALAAEINRTLGAHLARGVLTEVAVVPLPEALMRIGPVAPPPGGWRAVILHEVYGGVVPGALDTTFPVLVAQITARSREPAAQFALALQGIPSPSRR